MGKVDSNKISTADLFKQIHNEEGLIKGFYKGFSINVIKTPISNGIAWTIKNILNRIFDKNFKF